MRRRNNHEDTKTRRRRRYNLWRRRRNNHEDTKTRRNKKMRNYSLSDSEERIATIIVNAAYAVHKAIGPGLLENIYEVCFCHELTKQGLSIKRQVTLPITYD